VTESFGALAALPPVAYYNRGVAYGRKGEYDRALADLNKAIEINPKYAGAYNNRGKAYGLKGEYDHAIADFSKAIEIDPIGSVRLEPQDPADDMIGSRLVGRVEVPGLDRWFEGPHDDPGGVRTQIQSLPVQEHGLRQVGPLGSSVVRWTVFRR